MIKFANKNNINLTNSSLKKAICIGEPIRDNDFKINQFRNTDCIKLKIKNFIQHMPLLR